MYKIKSGDREPLDKIIKREEGPLQSPPGPKPMKGGKPSDKETSNCLNLTD